jgi:hypothetical protein
MVWQGFSGLGGPHPTPLDGRHHAVHTRGAFLVGTVGIKIQDQHSAQRNSSCENPMHGVHKIFDESLGKLEAIGCRGEGLDWCM